MPMITESESFDILRKVFWKGIQPRKRMVVRYYVTSPAEMYRKYDLRAAVKNLVLLDVPVGGRFAESSFPRIVAADVPEGQYLLNQEEPEENVFTGARLAELERENSRLRAYVECHSPPKRILDAAKVFSLFFSGVLSAQLLLGIPLMSSGLAWTGLGVSVSGLLLCYLAGRDWEEWTSGKGR